MYAVKNGEFCPSAAVHVSRNASRSSSDFWHFYRPFLVRQLGRRSGTDGNLIHSEEIQNVSEPDAQQVYEILLKMLDRWNAHDIEGHLEVYWKSPKLLVVVDSEQFTAGSNCMILASTGIRIVIRWASCNPNASKSSC